MPSHAGRPPRTTAWPPTRAINAPATSGTRIRRNSSRRQSMAAHRDAQARQRRGEAQHDGRPRELDATRPTPARTAGGRRDTPSPSCPRRTDPTSTTATSRPSRNRGPTRDPARRERPRPQRRPSPAWRRARTRGPRGSATSAAIPGSLGRRRAAGRDGTGSPPGRHTPGRDRSTRCKGDPTPPPEPGQPRDQLDQETADRKLRQHQHDDQRRVGVLGLEPVFVGGSKVAGPERAVDGRRHRVGRVKRRRQELARLGAGTDVS